MTQLDHALLTKLNPVVIDFETYYDKTYSLSNKEMTTQQYILDDRFELIGVGIKELGKPPSWYTGAAIKPALDTLKLHTRVVVAHNAVFDGTILSLQLGIIPRLLIDTMSLMRPIGANLLTPSSLAACATFLRTQGVDIADKGDAVVQALGKSLGHFTPQELAEYGDYCMHDCEIALALLNWQLTNMGVVDVKTELLWQDTALRTHTAPVLKFDSAMIESELVAVIERQEAFLTAVGATAKQLGSNETFAAMLTEAGAIPPTKISPTTGKEVYAFAKTDEGMQVLQEAESEQVTALVAARLNTKSTLQQKRCQRFLALAQQSAICVPYNIHGASTGRLSGADKINMQNLPSGRVEGQSNALRRSIYAPEGYTLVAFDIGAIEPRVLSYLANDVEMLTHFTNNVDAYVVMAGKIYGAPHESIANGIAANDPAEKLKRQVGKAAVLSLGYGSGVQGFLKYCKTVAKVEMDEIFAQQVVDTYRRERSAVVDLWQQCDKALQRMVVGMDGAFGHENRLIFGKHLGIPYIRAEAATPNFYYQLSGQPAEKGVEYTYKRRLGRALMSNKIYGAKVVENLTQGLAFDYMKRMALALRKEYGYNIVMNIHDEFVLCVPENELNRAILACEDVATRNYAWGVVPLKAEVTHAKRYGDC